MTAIVINAISVREGGSLVVLRELLVGMSALRPHWHWQVVVNSKAAGPLPELPNVEYLRFPKADQSGWRTRLWYETGLPALLERLNADLLFSMTNYLPLRRLSCPALLLVQHAGHFSPVFRQLTEAQLGLPGRVAWRLKGRWVRSSIRVADAVTVQTEALAGQVVCATGVACNHIKVIPHGAGQAMLQSGPVALPAAGEKFRVGYITKFGAQKNFAVLFEAVACLRRKGMPLSLVLTLSETDPKNQAVLGAARRHGVVDVIENHGELRPEAIARLYDSLHAFVFPSLCESFGFPMVEAMAHGLPLLVADTGSNIEVAGAAGVSFPSRDPVALADEIERLAGDRDRFRQCAQASLARGAEYAWAKAATETVFLMDDLISNRGLQAHTKAHYDDFPFDFLTAEDERNIEALQPAPFRRFADAYLKQGTRAAEVGCGPGRGTLFMMWRGVNLLAVDISPGSLRLARQRAPDCHFVQATNLQLPLPDEFFDAVVSDGVIHHTPDAYRSFSENARILKQGGVMYVGVYRRQRYYYYLYTYLGRPVRWLEKRGWGKALIHATLLPLYYAAHLVKSRGKRTWRGAKNFFYDYIITPQATFHTREEIELWGCENGLELVEYDENVGNVHAFMFRKEALPTREAK